MAITQQNIINQIPIIIKYNNFDLILTLRSLACYGWGRDSEVYKTLDVLLDEVTDMHGSERLRFDPVSNLAVKIQCKKCNDRGEMVIRRNGKSALVKCKKCKS